jgi:hypothetical protein
VRGHLSPSTVISVVSRTIVPYAGANHSTSATFRIAALRGATRVARIERMAGLRSGPRIFSFRIITKAMRRVSPLQPGKPERALQQTA